MDPVGTAGGDRTTGECYRFDDIVVDAVAHTLTRDGQVCAVEPKAFGVLLLLLRHAGELVSHDTLIDEVWGHRHVTPGVLTRVISMLRTALGDQPHQPRFIQTQHALGYRFIGELIPASPEVPVARADETPQPDAGGSADREDAVLPASAVVIASGVPDAPDMGDATAEAPFEPAASSDGDPSGDDPSCDETTASRALQAKSASGAVDADLVADPAHPPHTPLTPWRGIRDRRRSGIRAKLALALAVLALAIVVTLGWFQRDAITARPAEASIAVLPFTSLGSDRDDSYFAEGLAVEMHDALAGVPGLQVAARTAAVAAQDRDPDIKALGRALGVATVLDASVRREGERIRINARLSDTRTGFTLWSDSYDRDASDVFALQSEIANEVVQALLGVLPAGRPELGKRLAPTRDIAAYEAYLKGQQQLQVTGADGRIDGAIASFREALAADPQFARAQAGICRAEIIRFEEARDTPAFERAQEACMRATRLDPALREVSLALGEMYRVRGEFSAATEHYTRALDDMALRPAAYVGLARTQGAQGRNALALEYFEQARRLRPGDDAIYRELGYHQYLTGDVPAAIESFRTATTLLPDDAGLWGSLGGLYLANGDTRRAAAAFERSLAIKPSYGALSNYGTLRYDEGAYSEAADLYRHAAELDPGDYRIWGNIGDALAASPTTAAQAIAPYREAAAMAERYVAVKDSDAQALALLAWYRANLGDGDAARARLAQAEALNTELGEVAFCNAQTLALLGDAAAARDRLRRARAADIPMQRIRTSPVLRRLLSTDIGVSSTQGESS